MKERCHLQQKNTPFPAPSLSRGLSMPYTNSLSGSAYADVLTLPTVGLIIVTLLDEAHPIAISAISLVEWTVAWLSCRGAAFGNT